MRTIQENNFWGKVSAFLSLIKNPCKNLLYSIFRKAMPEVIADGRKVRDRLIQKISQKPTVSNVHVDFLYSTPQGSDPIEMLN